MRKERKTNIAIIIAAITLIVIVAVVAIVFGGKKKDEDQANSGEPSTATAIEEPGTDNTPDVVQEEVVQQSEREIVTYDEPVNTGTMKAIRLPSGLPYVNWALTIAKDDTFGYSQSRRNGDPDFDKTSFIYYALTQEGFQVGSYPFGDLTAAKDALMMGGFSLVEVTSPDILLPGDILLNDRHIEIYVGNGQSVGARHGEPYRDENGGVSYRMENCIVGDQDGTEISVGPYMYAWWADPNNGTHYVLRPPANYNVDGSVGVEMTGNPYAAEEMAEAVMPVEDLPFRLFDNDEDMVQQVPGAFIDLMIDGVEKGKLELPQGAYFLKFELPSCDIVYTYGGDTIALKLENDYCNK